MSRANRAAALVGGSAILLSCGHAPDARVATRQAPASGPLRWEHPPGYDPTRKDLGLAPLTTATKITLFDPAPCDGTSEICGTYNHTPRLLRHRGHVVVQWQNHLCDENGPGQRVLAAAVPERGGGPPGEPVVLAPSPVPFARRSKSHAREVEAGVLGGVYVWGELRLRGGALYFFGRTLATIGWTDAAQLRKRYDATPIPSAHWRAERSPRTGFDLDVWFGLGMDFVQRWDVVAGRLVPTSQPFFTTPLRQEVEITPGLRLKVRPLEPPYADRAPIEQAPEDVRRELAAPAERVTREPPYAPASSHVSCEPGHDRLAHGVEYRTRDGLRVAVRDNLDRIGWYYASVRTGQPVHGCARSTNLPGWGLMSAGELPNGSSYIVGGLPERYGLYVTRSDDGLRYACTWTVDAGLRQPFWSGLFKPPSGPQYPDTLVAGDSLWVAYSIGKQRIGLAKIPVAALLAPDPRACAPPR